MLKSQYKNTNRIKDQDNLYFSKPTTFKEMLSNENYLDEPQNLEFKRTITKSSRS